jgi:hypothetical protein
MKYITIKKVKYCLMVKFHSYTSASYSIKERGLPNKPTKETFVGFSFLQKI